MDLSEKIYQKLLEVPSGKVTTYADLAQACETRGYRAVGQILKNNPFAPEVPCHRVVRSDGGIGGFMGQRAGKEVEKKIGLLREEGVEVRGMKVDLDKFGFRFG